LSPPEAKSAESELILVGLRGAAIIVVGTRFSYPRVCELEIGDMDVKRSEIIIKPNIRRVLFRPFEPEDAGRVLKIIARVMELSDGEVETLLNQVRAEFHGRHHRLDRFFLRRFEAVRQHLLTDRELTDSRKLLIGAYFTQEYALESAALFNPSMVRHPNQAGLPKGTQRFIMSLRATGEGHISSLSFRSGVIDEQGTITLDKPTGYVTAPEVVPNSVYEKPLFQRKLVELGLANGFVELALGALDESFTMAQLEESIRFVLRQHRARRQEWEPLARGVLALAKANYEIECDPQSDISERIIFPYSPTEVSGIEDARFVEFTDNDETRYYATYTAFDGTVTLPQLVETTDFLRFRISTLNGPEVRNKGMALFPRKINGQYAMLSRQDGENLYLMYSDMLHFWYTKELICKPTFPWEFVQIGNCGSPIETDAGWLVLSHGVGPMRKYSIGAMLLDRDDPRRVLGRLQQPLLTPNENEREGYVPNVVYSCGAFVHGKHLIIPYAMSDYATTFAVVGLKPLLERLC
jgi:predicted GH43/DUF377 family glycosyl hydrolase